MKLHFVDTNIFIRFLTGKPAEQANISKKIFEKVESGEVRLFVSDLVIAEIVYVLESVYRVDKTNIAEKISFFLNIKNIKVNNKSMIKEALDIYSRKNIDFTDAFIVSQMKKMSCSDLFSFDADFNKFNFIKISN